jgi:hypothetical protein
MSADQLRQLLREVTPHPEVAIQVHDVRRGARRRRARRVVIASGVAIVVGAVGIGAWNKVDPPTPPDPTPAPPITELMTWQPLPDMPLSPRYDSLTVWTGSEALVIGGIDNTFNGGPAPMPELSDGAAFDPETATWRSIAKAPHALASRSYGPHVLVGDVLIVAEWDDWLAYDIGEDEWRKIPRPPLDVSQVTLAADPTAHVVYALDPYVVEGDHAPVQVLDLDGDTWSALPASDNEPRLDQRTLVFTDAGLVVMGDHVVGRQPEKEHRVERAELWDGSTWTRFTDSQADVNGSEWFWTGERVIAAYRLPRNSVQHGGDYRWRPGALDPATGEWSVLPWAPSYGDGLLDAWAITDGERVVSGGYLYDDADESSHAVPRPRQDLDAGSVALGGGWLMTFGGSRAVPGQEPSRVTQIEPAGDVWVMRVDLG